MTNRSITEAPADGCVPDIRDIPQDSPLCGFWSWSGNSHTGESLEARVRRPVTATWTIGPWLVAFPCSKSEYRFRLPLQSCTSAVLDESDHTPVGNSSANSWCQVRNFSNQSCREMRLYNHRAFRIAESFVADLASITLVVVFDHFVCGGDEFQLTTDILLADQNYLRTTYWADLVNFSQGWIIFRFCISGEILVSRNVVGFSFAWVGKEFFSDSLSVPEALSCDLIFPRSWDREIWWAFVRIPLSVVISYFLFRWGGYLLH